MPLHDHLIRVLRNWQRRTAYQSPVSWVFASPQQRGKGPYWGQQLLRHHIRPAAHKGRYCQAHRVAHFSSDVFHAAPCYRCRTQGHAGTDAAFDNPCHAGHVHPSGDHREACGTNCSGLAFCGQEGKQGNLKGPKCWESLSRGWQWRVGRLLFPAELRLCLFGPFLCLRWDREFSVSY